MFRWSLPAGTIGHLRLQQSLRDCINRSLYRNLVASIRRSRGNTCDDGNLCSGPDVVRVGSASDAFDHDDGNPCTMDVCDPVTGFEHIPLPMELPAMTFLLQRRRYLLRWILQLHSGDPARCRSFALESADACLCNDIDDDSRRGTKSEQSDHADTDHVHGEQRLHH